MGHGPRKYIGHVAREIRRLSPLIPLDKNFPKWEFPPFSAWHLQRAAEKLPGAARIGKGTTLVVPQGAENKSGL